MAFGKVQNLRDLRFGHFVGINPAQPHALLVNVKHDPRRLLCGPVEEPLQNENDELHRGVVIIQQKDTIERRLLRPGSRLRREAEIGTILIP